MTLALTSNWTVRSASDLLADLTACRQLRHLTEAQRVSVAKYFFGEKLDYGLSKPRLLDHVRRFYVWTYEAFEIAFAHFGAHCDCCPEISEIPEDRLRRCADRALDNLDGRVKLMLCTDCSQNFTRFCGRQFDREVRVPYGDDLEKMMLAWLAFQVNKAARKVIYAHHTGSHGRADNRTDAQRRDHSAHLGANGRRKRNDTAHPKRGRRGSDDVPVREAGPSPGLVLGTLPSVASPASVHAAMARQEEPADGAR